MPVVGDERITGQEESMDSSELPGSGSLATQVAEELPCAVEDTDSWVSPISDGDAACRQSQECADHEKLVVGVALGADGKCRSRKWSVGFHGRLLTVETATGDQEEAQHELEPERSLYCHLVLADA
jgi:hypothetical protein